MPALSVIVPCYNVEAFTPTLLASIERNQHDDIEFVMVEDPTSGADEPQDRPELRVVLHWFTELQQRMGGG